MVKKEVRPGEGGQQEQSDNKLTLREESPLVPKEDVRQEKPRGLLGAELLDESIIPMVGREALKRTRVRLTNLTPDIERKLNKKSPKPPASE